MRFCCTQSDPTLSFPSWTVEAPFPLHWLKSSLASPCHSRPSFRRLPVLPATSIQKQNASYQLLSPQPSSLHHRSRSPRLAQTPPYPTHGTLPPLPEPHRLSSLKKPPEGAREHPSQVLPSSAHRFPGLPPWKEGGSESSLSPQDPGEPDPVPSLPSLPPHLSLAHSAPAT